MQASSSSVSFVLLCLVLVATPSSSLILKKRSVEKGQCGPNVKICFVASENDMGSAYPPEPVWTCEGPPSSGTLTPHSSPNSILGNKENLDLRYGVQVCGPAEFSVSPMTCGGRFEHTTAGATIKSSAWSSGSDCVKEGAGVNLNLKANYFPSTGVRCYKVVC